MKMLILTCFISEKKFVARLTKKQTENALQLILDDGLIHWVDDM